MTNNSALSFAIACSVGLMSGAHTSIWGMYKDAIHEGFGVGRFLRSITIGGFAAVVIQFFLRLPIPDAGSLVMLFGLAYAVERLIVEVWKTFIRVEDQSKYFIPMQFSIRGIPVASVWVRFSVGVAYVAAVAGILTLIARLGEDTVTLSHLSRAGLSGLVMGMLLAVGGAWKDAPKEGFDIIKFFRSPMMTVFYGLILSQISTDILLIAVAATGYERATAETYKTFFFPSRPRGKFNGKPVLFPALITQRRYFVPVYAAICVSVIACAAAAL